MDSNNIIIKMRNVIVDCIISENNKEQLDRFNIIVDLLNMLVKTDLEQHKH